MIVVKVNGRKPRHSVVCMYRYVVTYVSVLILILWSERTEYSLHVTHIVESLPSCYRMIYVRMNYIDGSTKGIRLSLQLNFFAEQKYIKSHLSMVGLVAQSHNT